MAIGTSLQQLVLDVKAELFRASSVAVNTEELLSIKQKLKRTQELLYDEHDWSHLRVFKTLTLAAGQRYYDPPTGIVIENTQEIARVESNEPIPIDRGIGFPEFAAFNSDADDRSDPVLRWDIVTDDATSPKEQFEVWPIPAQAGSLLILSKRNLRTFVADTDLASIDDRLLTLRVASEMLGRQKKGEVNALAQLATQRLEVLQRRSKAGRRTVSMGGQGSRASRRGHAVIRVAS